MRKLTSIAALVLALNGCVTDYDPTPDLAPGEVATAKADGAFGAEDLEVGGRATGSTGGDGIVLYALDLDAGDQLRVTVRATSGDLRPSAYLYRGTETYVRPATYDAGAAEVTLDYDIEADGEHHIVVKAYRGEGSGDFELSVECIGGTCDGIPNDPIAAQSQCIQGAARCAIAALPGYGGAVGEVRANRVFDDCLIEQGAHCAAACEGDGADACGRIVGQLPGLADQDTACHDVLTQCLSGCEEIGGYYSAYDFSGTAAVACWDGYNGNCLELIAGHASCGGSEYEAGTRDECLAYCAATEGAWDEGPWDGCTDECSAL